MQTTRHKVFDTLQCGISLKLISVKTQVSLESIEAFCIEEQYADSLANSAVSAVGRGGSSDKLSHWYPYLLADTCFTLRTRHSFHWDAEIVLEIVGRITSFLPLVQVASIFLGAEMK